MSDDTATIERDLAAVETALASGAATHADPLARELQELALRAERRPAAARAGSSLRSCARGWRRVSARRPARPAGAPKRRGRARRRR